MEARTRAPNPWVIGSVCIVALFATWTSYFAVYAVLPHGTPLAHWGLFVLALSSTAGAIVTLEKVVDAAVLRPRTRTPRETA